MRSGSRAAVGAAMSILAFCVAGCRHRRATWDASGEYYALLTNEEQPQFGSRNAIHGAEELASDKRIGTCDVHEVTWLVLAAPGLDRNDRVASITTTLSHPLCQVGVDSVSAGYVMLFYRPGGDTNELSTQRSDAWSVTGRLNVTEVLSLDPPEPAVGQQAVSETARGTFSLAAQGPGGRAVQLETGTFEFNIVERRQKPDPTE